VFLAATDILRKVLTKSCSIGLLYPKALSKNHSIGLPWANSALEVGEVISNSSPSPLKQSMGGMNEFLPVITL
jgi:hypothetical protein